MNARTSAANHESRLFWSVLLVEVVLLAVMAAVSVIVWGRPDPLIMYVPVPIVQWSFAGGMVAVLYRLAYRRGPVPDRLYSWAIAKPVIGMFQGCIIYFLALGGGILVGANLTKEGQLPHNLWLNAFAFVGGFSDRFSNAVIGRLLAVTLGDDQNESDDRKDSPERPDH